MTEDGREVRKQAIMKRATQLTPSPEVNVDVLYQLVHTPDVYVTTFSIYFGLLLLSTRQEHSHPTTPYYPISKE